MSTAPPLTADFLYALGAGSIEADDVLALTGSVQRRRVRVLEVIRREAAAAGSPASELIHATFQSIAAGRSTSTAINDPFLGIWAEAVLRGERSIDEPGAAGRLVDLGLDIDGAVHLDITTLDGHLHLARCGGHLDLAGHRSASVAVSAGLVEVRSGAGAAVLTPEGVTTDGAIVWHPSRTVRFDAGDLALNIELGSRDPATTAVGPSRPLNLDEAGFATWTSALGRAWGHLASHHTSAALAVAAATSVVIPQEGHDDTRHVSSSNSDGFGAIGLSFTEDLPTLAVGMVHETRHNLLSAALAEADLHDDDDSPTFYAGWRDDPRPVGALMQGACAFAAVTDFWRREHDLSDDGRSRRRSALEVTRWWAFTTDAIDQLATSDHVTPLGQAFLDGLRDLVGVRPKVEPLVAAAGSDLIAEHRTAWHAARAAAEPEDPAPFVGTTLADAWNQRLFAVSPRRHIDVVDLALVADDPAAATEVAAKALLQDPDDPAALFRFARALHRSERSSTSDSILRRLRSRNTAEIVNVLRRLILEGAVDASAVAEALDHMLTSGRPHELATTSTGAV
jgi:HEXXH motif-containing protein